MLLLSAVAAAGGERVLRQFDAGATLLLRPGEAFSVELERPAGEAKQWRWLVIDDRVVRTTAPPLESKPADRPDVVVETHPFVAVAPGVANLCAELFAPGDPTRVFARYPISVQVVSSPRAPESPAR
jgi:hypothetical protein